MSSLGSLGTRAEGTFELLGASLHSAPIEVLERLALAPEELQRLYRRLKSVQGVDDALVLSTCNRTEVYVNSQGAQESWGRKCWEILQEIIGANRVPGEEHRYSFRGEQGVEHLFRVSCGLDSVVLGEAQILGQVKDAYDSSREHFQSTYFDKVMQSAFRVASRSRSETEIGAGVVSVASAGVHLAGRVFSDFSDRTVVVIGAGDTGRLVAEHFARRHPGRMIIVNRTHARAETLAARVGAEAWPLERLSEALEEADIVASAVRVTQPLLTRSLIAGAMRRRVSRHLAVLDLGLPRNVAEEVNGIVNVFLNDIETLKQVVDTSLQRRRKEVPQVEGFIHEEIGRLLNWQRSFQAGPLIGTLRAGLEEARRAEVVRVTRGMGPAELEAVDRATRAVINKLAHGPMKAIHTYAREAERGADGLELIRAMFENIAQSPSQAPSELDVPPA